MRTIESKRCGRCQEIKDYSEFYNNKSTLTGKSSYCKDCNNYANKTHVKYKEYHDKAVKNWKSNNLDQIKSTAYDRYYLRGGRELARQDKLLRRYNLTLEQYLDLSIQQNDLCKICGKLETRMRNGQLLMLAVDHDHNCCPNEYSCGKCVRGLLCHKCNSAIGLLQDNPELLEKAAVYVRGCD